MAEFETGYFSLLPPGEPFVALYANGSHLELSRGVMTVQVRRQPRAKCAICHLRRVLYRIAALMAGGAGETEARCGGCWGFRE